MDGDKKFVIATYVVIIGAPLIVIGVITLAALGITSLLK